MNPSVPSFLFPFMEFGTFATLAAIIVGLIDTLGRAFLPDLLRAVLNTNTALTLAPALSSMSIYMLMAGILVFRPEGLFPAASK